MRQRVVAPSGRAVLPDDLGVHTTLGDGYAVVTIDRPAPGRWRIRAEGQRSAHVVAAFVTSPLWTKIQLPARLKPRAEAAVAVRSWFDGAPLGPARTWARSRLMPTVRLPKELLRAAEPGWSDRLPRGARASIGLAARPSLTTAWPAGRGAVPAGLSRVEIEVEGRLPGGAPFRRVALRTIRA